MSVVLFIICGKLTWALLCRRAFSSQWMLICCKSDILMQSTKTSLQMCLLRCGLDWPLQSTNGYILFTEQLIAS